MRDTTKLEAIAAQAADVALGRSPREDPVVGRTGGPAGNARLTAWTGLILLLVFVAELVTLLDVRGLISWHLALGVALIPPSLLKTASTGWRILRYYLGHPTYRRAGPPPAALRLLGPLVVAGTLALLGTGLALVLLGEPRSRVTLATVLGQRIDVLTLHQGAFAVWAVVTGLHVILRALTAWHLTRPEPTGVPAGGGRLAVLVVVLAVSIGLVGWVLARPSTWDGQRLTHTEVGTARLHGR